MVYATGGRKVPPRVASDRAFFSGLIAILPVVGVMDLRATAVVAAAITVERLAPAGERVARAIGAIVVGAGLFLLVRAL
jgi:predicted metal-binding membrane protein